MRMKTVHLRHLTRPDDESWRQAMTGSASPTAVHDAVDAAACPVCPHPTESHDAIGSRYCAATAAGKFERGCVCVGGSSAP